MYHLSRARQRESHAGIPLKTVWKRLQLATVSFRLGQLHLVASGPGVGKSLFALTLAVRSGASGIYMSADSDSATQYARAVSMLTGELVSEVQKKVENGETKEYDDVLDELHRIRFDFNAGPSLDDIEQCVYDYAIVHGRHAQILIVDNLSNCIDDSGGEGYQALENILAYLHELARRFKICVVVLHHLTGLYEDGTEPPPLSGLRGKVSKLPELILNLYRDTNDIDAGIGMESLGVAIVKNRGGQAHAAAGLTVSLALDLAHMSITDSVSDDDWEMIA